MSWRRVDTPIGLLTLHSNADGLVAIDWPQAGASVSTVSTTAAELILDQAEAELAAFFGGDQVVFATPLAPSGTPFQKQVWQALRAIPYGETTTYGAIANELGKPGASRAVGAATGKNPIPIIIPCHRLVGSDGSLTGFSGGLDAKQALLRLEQGAN